MSEQSGLGEQALNKAAEIGMSSQLDEVVELDIDIKTDPLKFVQGEVDSVDVEGKGLVMQKDLRMEAMDMHMDNVAINPLSAAMGKIELNKPTDAETHVVLTEADVNHAFNSEYVGSKLKNLKIDVDGKPMTVDAKQIEFHLPGEGKVVLKAQVLLHETGETEQIAFAAVPSVTDNGKAVMLKDVQYGEGKEISPELTKALVDQSSKILDLSNFNLEGMSLRIRSIDAEAGKLNFQAAAHVEQMPSSKTSNR
ncbi:MAG: DUF2993 domain-containing protein [Chroococcidiopsidaceae cyanobacterium CP_BM_ER_R8_30]|nr:DUF2993 domain-containing protein [Chroococcidiopsidaceae cyanobacterium CP_BM_ER_R8_30]